MKFSYQLQKAREALTCLMSESSMDMRLISAGRALSMFPLDGLPAEERRLAQIANRAFTEFPDTWNFPGEEGVVDALIHMLPDERKLELQEKVVGLFQAVCELRGREAIAPASIQPAAETELDSPDKWEFLFWNLSHSSVPDERALYVKYAQHWLPNFPAEVLLEWFGRHGYDSLRNWAHLPLEQLRFEEVLWDQEQLRRIQAIGPGHTDIGPETSGAYHLNRAGDWLGQHILQKGTWPAPIIVIDQPTAVKVGGCDVPAGLVLVEGHKRLSRMLNVAPAGASATARHKVMLGRGPAPSK